MIDPVERLEQRILTESAKTFLPNSVEFAVDVGGHTGYKLATFLGKLAKTSLVNLDIDKKPLLRGHERIDLHLQADCAKMPIREGAVDFILCSEVLEHVAHPDAVIIEFARILKSGGIIVLSTPSKNFFRAAYYQIRKWLSLPIPVYLRLASDDVVEQLTNQVGCARLHHLREGFAPSELLRLFSENGLQIINMHGVLLRFTLFLPFRKHIGIRELKPLNYFTKFDKSMRFLTGDVIIIVTKK